MSEIDDFLNTPADEVDRFLGTETMVCDGQTFAVVWNGATKANQGGFGLGIDTQAMAFAQPGDVTNPYYLRGKRCTVGSDSFRVSRVEVGSVAVQFTLEDPNAAQA